MDIEKIKGKKPLKLLILLLTSLLIATASVAAYQSLTWKTTATVGGYAELCFIKWLDGTKANTFNHDADIYQNQVTIEENITYGIENSGSTAKNVKMRLASVTTSSNLYDINCTVYNSTATVFTKEWTSTDFGALPSSWTLFSNACMPGNYTIWLELNCTATASGQSEIIFDLQEYE